ncbi:hypothetical protein PINS_up009653 [Pythium insidiosum]|nr:hypothetical protein PINS_up009653 [Pythium insidiosum]
MARRAEDLEMDFYAPSPNEIGRSTGGGGDQPTYRYSYMNADTPGPRSSDVGSRLSSSGGPGGEVFVRGSLLDRTIEAAPTSQADGRPERARDYKGRRRVRGPCLCL